MASPFWTGIGSIYDSAAGVGTGGKDRKWTVSGGAAGLVVIDVDA